MSGQIEQPGSHSANRWFRLAAAVLNVASLVLGVLASLPALAIGVVGLVVLATVRGNPAGKGKASSVVAVGLGAIGTAVGALMFIPAHARLADAIARSNDDSNILKIGYGFLSYDPTVPGRFSPYGTSLKGESNRGLSWRVGLLPYIEQDSLYRRFKFTEAWDGPTNQPAALASVRQYLSGGDPTDNQTRFRVFVGPGTMFEDSPEWQRNVSTFDIPDGASNTLLVVDTADRVPWAAPQDIPYQPGGPLPALGHPQRNVIQIVMADGSVRPALKTISPAVLHALITRNGGETIPKNWSLRGP
jgi:hypothetical protein